MNNLPTKVEVQIVIPMFAVCKIFGLFRKIVRLLHFKYMKLSLVAICTFIACAFAVPEGRDEVCIYRTLNSKGYRYFKSVVDGARSITSMRVKTQYSSSQCIDKESYGFIGVDAWVHRGCRAKFEICYLQGVSRTVECSSNDYQRAVCPANVSYVYNVYPITHHSKSPCISNFSYGKNGTQIWVDKGCRATFRVTG